MSSINPYFTLNYEQPSEYQFSHDSVFLARYVFEEIKNSNLNYSSILDLCSGCGIVGIDLLFHLFNEKFNSPIQIDFLEVQEIYQPYFNKNITKLLEQFNTKLNYDLLSINYNAVESLNLSMKYDLIVSNPPYFRKEQGKLSNSEFKNRCRFFIDSDFSSLIKAIDYCLNKNGLAFILLKSLIEHGIDIENEMLNLKLVNLNFKKISKIRDTDLYLFTKIS